MESLNVSHPRQEWVTFINSLVNMERIRWDNVGSLYLRVMKSEGRFFRGDCRTSVQSTVGIGNCPLQLLLGFPQVSQSQTAVEIDHRSESNATLALAQGNNPIGPRGFIAHSSDELVLQSSRSEGYILAHASNLLLLNE